GGKRCRYGKGTVEEKTVIHGEQRWNCIGIAHQPIARLRSAGADNTLWNEPAETQNSEIPDCPPDLRENVVGTVVPRVLKPSVPLRIQCLGAFHASSLGRQADQYVALPDQLVMSVDQHRTDIAAAGHVHPLHYVARPCRPGSGSGSCPADMLAYCA